MYIEGRGIYMPPCGQELRTSACLQQLLRFERAFYLAVGYEMLCKYKETITNGAPIPVGA